jgi:hypothetical protein
MLLVVLIFDFKFSNFQDIFLFNAADQGSWHQWDTTSNLTKIISSLLKNIILSLYYK